MSLLLLLQNSGTSGTTGSVSASLGSVSLSSSGTLQAGLTGTVSVNLGAISLSSSGVLTAGASGSLSKTLGAGTLASTGSVSTGPSGVLDASLGAVTLSASGSVLSEITASVAQTLGSAIVQSTGIIDSPVVPQLGETRLQSGGLGGAQFYRGKYRGELRRTIESAVREATEPTRSKRRKTARSLKARAEEFIRVFDIAVPARQVLIEAPELGGLEVIRRQILDLSRNLAGVQTQARQREEDRLRSEAETSRMLRAAFLAYLEEVRRIEQREEEDVISLIMALDAKERM